MVEPRNNGEEMGKEVENFSTGKLEHEEKKSVIHIPEEIVGENYIMKANEEQKNENKIDSPKKSRENNLKTNVTVPRPFNLATEKRMTRERKRSMDFEKPKRSLSKSSSLKPNLSKSASFNPKTSLDLNGPKSSSVMTSLKPKVRTNKKEDKNTEVKHTENQSKKHGGDNSKNTPKENSAFKALPLPSFYKQKDFPTTSETKKMVVQRSRTPVVGTQVKTLLKSDSHKIESNAKRVPMGIGSGAKETIRKVRNTKNSPKTNPKSTVKDLILSDA